MLVVQAKGRCSSGEHWGEMAHALMNPQRREIPVESQTSNEIAKATFCHQIISTISHHHPPLHRHYRLLPSS